MDSVNYAKGKFANKLQNALIDGATFLLNIIFEIGLIKGLQKDFIALFLKRKKFRSYIFVYMNGCMSSLTGGLIFAGHPSGRPGTKHLGGILKNELNHL